LQVQEAQLSQRDRAMLGVIEYFAKGALHRLNQMVNRLVNHLDKCMRVARSPDRRLKLT